MARLRKIKDPNELFVTTAQSIIAREGLKAFNLRELAKKAGYSLGSIYTYFNNADDLALQVNGNTLEALYEKIEKSIKNKAGRKKIMAAANAYFDFASENKNLWHAVMDFSRPVTPEIQHWYQAKVDALLRLVKEALAPELKKGQDVHESASILWAGLQGLWLMHNRESFRTSSNTKPNKLLELMVEKLVC